MSFKHCKACGKKFQNCPQVTDQLFCSDSKCQRERRRRWKNKKRKSDPDYQDNQSRAQKSWSRRNPNYWREYRRRHPEYRDRNRTLQQKRNDKQKIVSIAKRNSWKVEITDSSSASTKSP